jgi:zinc-binding alcohol dehydrogenase/oxidoreductase
MKILQKKMNAVLFYGKEKPVAIGSFAKPILDRNSVLIRLEYAALNHIDVWRIKEQPGLPGRPVIPGCDGAGVIEATGDSVKSFSKGQEVIINPGLQWGNDIKGPGSEFRILGYPDNGTFAEYIVVDKSQVYAKPTHLTLMQAAALPLAGITAYRALFTRGGIRKHQNVLITGIGGGVAQTLLQMAVAEGAHVYVNSGTENKISLAKSSGAVNGFIYKDPEWVMRARETVPDGFDLIVDSAAGEGFHSLIELTKMGGTIVMFGRTAGMIPALHAGKLFNKQINILGTTMGSPQEFAAMLDYYERQQLYPVIDSVFQLHDFHTAFQRMECGNQTGKIVLKIY